MNNLKVTSEELLSASNTMTTEAANIEKEISTISTLVGDTKAVWQGDSATAYFSKFEQLSESLAKVVTKTKTYGEKLEKMGKNYETSETNNTTTSSGLDVDIF